jgi:hypothetical protein
MKHEGVSMGQLRPWVFNSLKGWAILTGDKYIVRGGRGGTSLENIITITSTILASMEVSASNCFNSVPMVQWSTIEVPPLTENTAAIPPTVWLCYIIFFP